MENWKIIQIKYYSINSSNKRYIQILLLGRGSEETGNIVLYPLYQVDSNQLVQVAGKNYVIEPIMNWRFPINVYV